MAAIQTTTTPVLPVPQPMPDEVVLAHGKADAAYTPAMAIQIALVLAICLVTLPLAPSAYAFASRTLRMHAWWVTNQRIVVRTADRGAYRLHRLDAPQHPAGPHRRHLRYVVLVRPDLRGHAPQDP
jgi:hypothetical protein